MEPIDEIMQEFLVESYENLDQLDQDLLELEEVPDDCDRLASIFRTIHTIKGTSGFLALGRLERVTHVGESLLVPLRDGEIQLTNEITDGLLKMVDAVRTILQSIESTGSEGDEDYAELIKRLEDLQDQARSGLFGETDSGAESSESSSESETPVEAQAEATESTEAAEEVADAKSAQEQATPQPDDAQSAEPQKAEQPAKEPAVQSKPESSKPTPSAKASQKSGAKAEGAGAAKSVADQTLRIDVQILDNVMNLVGELVLSRNQVLQFNSGSEDSAVNAALQKLNHVTTELQEAVMKTRMQPIRNAWNKLPRVVRDLASSCGKKVQVEMEGADTELDKTVLEAIKDPLTHIVRNSVDHGIEAPEQRVTVGKPEVGTLWLRAFHEGGQVNIEIADDGKGMDLDRIREKGIEKGIVTPEQAEAMNDREVLGLVLLPGFSTAAAVTNVSGRGVGMDVVKTNIESIGGTLDIQSSPGKGTNLRIKLPLTLAIVPALVVSSAGQNFAIPQVNLLELVRLDAERAAKDIEYVYGAPVYRLRGNLLPLLYLDELLQLREPRIKELSKAKGESESEVQHSPEHSRELIREIAASEHSHELDESAGAGIDEEQSDFGVNIVVLQAEDRQFGLVVDGITDTQEIVVKPLDQYLKNISVYAGATIMGNGSVSLILDTIGMAQKGGILSENDTIRRDDRRFDAERTSKNQSWLLVDPGDGSRAAVQLDTVARLEEFSEKDVETVDNRSVVQYRGQIMPLVDAKGSSVRVKQKDSNETTHVVVYSDEGRNIGMVVDRIWDIVKEPIADEEEGENSQRVIGGRVTKVIKPEKLLASAAAYLI